MYGHGGCLPRDMLLSNLAAGSIAPMALLRIVHHFNQVQPSSCLPFPSKSCDVHSTEAVLSIRANRPFDDAGCVIGRGLGLGLTHPVNTQPHCP
jgi:hypothetical protein